MVKEVESLHIHTITSDGECSYEEALQLALKVGISTLAFTDHDSLPSKDILEMLKFLPKSYPNWLIGIEISSGLPKRLGGGQCGDFHILGLGVNPDDLGLKGYCQEAQEDRDNRMRRMVENLNNLGFTITVEECRCAAGGPVIGRPHIVKALDFSGNPANRAVLNQILQGMKEEAGHNLGINQQYKTVLERGESQYPYALFLDDKAYIKGVYLPKAFWKSLEESVSLIREADGVAILAHYFTVREKIRLDVLEELLKGNVLDGAETVFGIGEISRDGQYADLVSRDRNLVKSLVARYGKIATGGGDLHKREDYSTFARSQLALETIGMAERVVDRLGPLNSWHSFSTSSRYVVV